MSNVLDLGTLDPRLHGLVRPADSRVTSGLCRAIAERYQVDPLLIRLAAIGLTLAGGLGLVAYAWGTVLTPRGNGEPPLRRLLPVFEDWSRTTQLAVVVLTMVVTVGLHGLRGSIPWGPVIIVGVIALLVRRRRAAAAHPDPRAWAPPTALGGSVEESLAAWRARMAAHGAAPVVPDQHLPEVDLYAPAPAPRPRSVPPERAPRSWWGAFAVVAIGAAAAGTPVLTRLTPNLLWAATAGTLAMGVALVGWALLVRSRRIPGAVLALALAAAAGTAGLASWAAEGPSPQASTAAHTTYWVVGDSNGVVDLREVPDDRPSTVRIVAKLAEVRVLLPGTPEHVTTSTRLGEVSGLDSGNRPIPLTLTVEANLAHVILQETP